jgi:uncharacterized membrane protein
MNWLLTFIKNFPPEIATMIVGAAPISELRGAIPLAYGVYNFSILKAFFFSFIGNAIPVFLVTFLMEVAYKILSRFANFKKFFEWLFDRTRRKISGQYLKYGEIALVIFVAIPLPMTGAWTGALAAWLLGIKPKVAIPLVLLGVLIAGIIVSILTVGAGKVFGA